MTDKYTNGKYLDRKSFLDQTDKSAFNESSEELSDFSARALKGMQYLNEEDSLSAILERLDNKIDKEVANMPRRRLSILQSTAFRAAAAVLLLLIPVYFLFLQSPSPNQLTVSYFEHQPSAIAQTGIERGDISDQSLKDQAFLFYDLEDYEKALPLFQKYFSINPDDLEARFYFGIALLGTGKAIEAAKQLEMVAKNPPRRAYLDAAQWNLALANIMHGEEEAAIEQLKELANKNGDYREKAQRLLTDLL